MTKTLSPWGSGNTQHFFSLTPDHILNACEQTGIRCTGRCLALNSMENRVYEVELDFPEGHKIKTPSEKFVVVKFYRPGRWTEKQINEEHQFLSDLVEADIPVVAPFQSNLGKTLHHFEELDLFFCLFPKMGGRSPDELGSEQSEQIGRLVARMHGVGSTKKAPHRIHLSPESYGIENLKWLIDSQFLPVELKQRFQSTVEAICRISSPWFAAEPSQRIHGDCHLGNLLWGDLGPFWVDFDDMVMGPPVQDLWLMIPGRDQWAQDKLRSILKGYEMMRPFSRSSLRLIEPLRALRQVHFAAWIGKRWDDPSFPRGFPSYNTQRWWAELLRDLESHVIAIQENPWANL